MEAIRILQVTDNMNRGGQETFIMNVYRNIDRSKVQFDFLISESEKCDYEDEIAALGGKVYRTVTKKSGIPVFIKSTNNILKEMGMQYKIAHIHTSSQLNAIAWLFTDIRKIPTRIVHSHNSMNDDDVRGNIKHFFSLIISKSFTFRFACSEVAGAWLFGNHEMERKSVRIVRNGVDAGRFAYNESSRQKIRKELNIADNFVIGHIGRFNKQKNHCFLVDVFAELYKLNNRSRLILVGVGELEADICQKVRMRGLEDSVLFLGLRTDINDIMSAIDVFVLPSLYEGLPVVGIEAQASGVKSVISDTITKELDITGLIDFVSLDESPKHWAERILRYNEGYERKNMHDAVSGAGYDMVTTAKEIETFYIESYSK